jgi:hypothetical protein
MVTERRPEEGEISEARQRDQDANGSRKECRAENQVTRKNAMDSKRHQGDVVAGIESARGARAVEKVKKAEIIQRVRSHDRHEDESEGCAQR